MSGAASPARNERLVTISGKNISLTPEIAIDRFEIFANGLDHPECLAFDREGILWAGGEVGQIYRVGRDGQADTVASLGGFSGGLAWTPDDSALYVCNPAHGVVRVQRSGKWSVFAADMICPNYGLFDSRGNYWVTDSGHWKKRNGRLLRFGPDGSRDEIGGPWGYTNGLALSADERFLFLVESDTDRIFRIDVRTGGAEVYAGEVGRLPDGLTLDAAGNLYAGCYASDDIYRISLAREKTLYAYDRWAILLSRPTNLQFHEGYIYVSNLGRTTITRARVGVAGKPLANGV
jgi:gluconolactonase